MGLGKKKKPPQENQKSQYVENVVTYTLTTRDVADLLRNVDFQVVDFICLLFFSRENQKSQYVENVVTYTLTTRDIADFQ